MIRCIFFSQQNANQSSAIVNINFKATLLLTIFKLVGLFLFYENSHNPKLNVKIELSQDFLGEFETINIALLKCSSLSLSLCSLCVSVAWVWNSIQKFIVIAKSRISVEREYSALARIYLQWNPKRELMCEKEFFAFPSLALLFLNVTAFHSCTAMIYAIFIFSFYLCHFSLSWEMHFGKSCSSLWTFAPLQTSY